MHPTIPVWQTLSDAFTLVYDQMNKFVLSLVLPGLLLIALEAVDIFYFSSPATLLLFRCLISLAELLVLAWMMNICCRIAITQVAGGKGWGSTETWSALWLLCLNLVITLLAGVPAFLVFLALTSLTPLLALPLALLLFLVLHLYLFARFILVFPATAMGDKASFREAWELSRGNGWRLVLLFALVPTLYALAALILAILLPISLFKLILMVIGLFFLLVGIVAVALAYKRLKEVD